MSQEVQITLDRADPDALCRFRVEALGYLRPPPPGFESWRGRGSSRPGAERRGTS